MFENTDHHENTNETDDGFEIAFNNERQAGWNAGFITASALWITLFGLLVLAFIVIG